MVSQNNLAVCGPDKTLLPGICHRSGFAVQASEREPTPELARVPKKDVGGQKGGQGSQVALIGILGSIVFDLC